MSFWKDKLKPADQLEKMMADLEQAKQDSQGGCAVCHSPTPRKVSRTGGEGEWTVDHDHKTGKVRGVVCHPCNTALGMADDSPERLRALADYLEKNK